MLEIIQDSQQHPHEPGRGMRGFMVWLKGPRPLGSKLAQWNALVLFIALALIELVVYQLVIYTVIANLDGQLNAEGRRIEAKAQQWTATGQPSDMAFLNQLVQDKPINEFSTVSLSIKIYDARTGRLLALSPYLSQVLLPLNQVDFRSALQGHHITSSMSDKSGNQAHILVLPLYDKTSKLVAVAQLVQSLQIVQQLQLTLGIILGAGGIMATAIAYVVGLMLTRRELRPLRLLISTMQRLDAQRLDEVRYHPRILTIEVIQLTEAFNAMLDRLQASFALQRNFIANISHEMRTPLTAILGQVDVMLIDPELKDGTRQYLQDIRTELRRISHLITNLLTSAREEAGMPPQPFVHGVQMVELDSLVVDVLREASFLYHRREQSGKDLVRIGELEQIQLPGDADLLKQLLLNLVDNAITYSAPVGHVSVSLTRKPPTLPFPGEEITRSQVEWAVLTICNSGPGITPEELPHIFERYYRSRKIEKSGEMGAGLGLSIVKMIAEAHGGYITVESEPGKETCFYVWLPTSHVLHQ
ncbi:MAG TPA: HAMP domain-containing sensor histidine kinase [Ktedonobacteraceae bacterium]|jgi:two-component system OmpR family sensor kinase|nr:HAMP domain-containing sensor histidine kinase [Ktedonobacteraceae bacterium]